MTHGTTSKIHCKIMKNIFEISPRDYHSQLTCDRSNILSPESWLSKSVIWELANASLFKWRYHPKEFSPTASMQWGSLVDALTTTPELVDDLVAVSPYADFKTGVARKWRDANLAEGRIVIKQPEFDEAKRAAEMLLATNKHSAEIFAKSHTQGVIGAKICGVQVKGLVDLAPEGESYLADLKTTNNFSIEGFSKTIATYGYHMQAGLYLELWNAMYPDDQRDGFRLIWQSSEAPYEVVVTELSEADIEAGYEYAAHLIEQLVKATEANHWPMLCESLVPTLTRPTWASIQEGEKIESAPVIEPRKELVC